MPSTNSEQAGFISSVQERSNRIVALAKEDILNYPSDKFTNIPVTAVAIYHHVRIFASGFADIHDFDESCGTTTAQAIATVSLQLDPIFRAGADKLSLDQGRSEMDVMATTPLATVLNVGLQSSYEGKQVPKGAEVYFFIVALNDLLHFVEFYSASYKTKKELRKASEREAALKATIEAMRFLSNAQMSLESGLQLMSTVHSLEKFRELSSKAANAEAQLLDARVKQSSNSRKAAFALHSKPGGSYDLKNQIRAIWESGKYSSRDACAEEEWRSLGYGSFKAARNALIGTPDPVRNR